MIRKCVCAIGMIFCFMAAAGALETWEKDGDFYYLLKNSREFFSASGAGPNQFASAFLTYDGINFLVRGPKEWLDYGRLDLRGNNMFLVPIRPGSTVDEVHFLAGGSYSNSYKEDPLLRLYGDNYYYSVVTVVLAYQDGTFTSLSVPVFWDWFHLGLREWSREGAKIKGLGNNPVRKDCSMYHVSFVNPRPSAPLKNILVSDSWLSDMPFSDVFAVTLKSRGEL